MNLLNAVFQLALPNIRESIQGAYMQELLILGLTLMINTIVNLR